MKTGTPSNLAVAIDIGGTFTDVTLLDPTTGETWRTKTPSTPEDQSIGFVAGVEKIAALAGRDRAKISQFFHATTVATNLILEGKGAMAAMLTSAGFRHVLEIGRHDIPEGENPYTWVKPKRPVPPELIFEIGGRISAEGDSSQRDPNRRDLPAQRLCFVRAGTARARHIGRMLPRRDRVAVQRYPARLPRV
jgi:N-methylhydantoinase A